MAGRFNFPQWNYGYPLGPPGNLGPPGYTGPGDYAQFYNYYGQPGAHASGPPRGSAPPHPPPNPNQKATAVKSEPPNTPPTAMASAMMKAAQVLQPNSVKPEPGIIEAMLGMARPPNKGGRPPKHQNHWNHGQAPQQPGTDMEIRKEQAKTEHFQRMMGCIRAEERHRDLIFLCGKETLRYHQAVVSPFSDMLTNLFALQNNCTGQCLDNRDVIVTLDNISCHTVHVLMNTVYTGRCENVKVSAFREIEILRRMLGLNISLTGMEAHIKVEMLGIDYPQALCTTSWGVGGAHRTKTPAEKLYHCDVCSMGFSRSYNLKVHMRIHSGERPYACDVCPMSFAASHNLTIHKRIHTGEKPFACDQCQRAFSASDNLKKHKRVHTGEKPFACDECPRAFSASGNLKVHKRTHTGERPYCCSKCPKAFSASDNLTKHRRRHLIAAQKALGLTGKDLHGFTGNEFKGFTNNDFKSVGFQGHPISPVAVPIPTDGNQSNSPGTSKQQTSPLQQPNDVTMSPCSNNTNKSTSPPVNNTASNHQTEIMTAQKTMGFNATPDFNFQKPANDTSPKQVIAQKSMGFPRLPDVPRLADNSNMMEVDWQKQDHFTSGAKSEELQQSTSRPTTPSSSPDTPSRVNKEESVSTPHSVFDSWHP